ncbi:MAG: hypothetical protein LBU36_03380 [Clostridiales bacterium]|jgi:uncharacterized membrane protein YkvI|nr:hypothetical protein [Clostridiales bacterium]
MNKKELTDCLKAAGVYAGLIIGAGFMSGREIIDFFLKYGDLGYAGMLLSCLAFYLCGRFVFEICLITGISSYREFSLKIFGAASPFLEFGSSVFMLALFSAMLAAAGSLCSEIWGIPVIIGSASAAALCFAVFLTGVSGFARLNLLLTPFMLIGGAASALSGARPTEALPGSLTLGGAVASAASAVVYASYNIASAAPVLVAASEYAGSRRAAKYAPFLASLGLLSLGLCVSLPFRKAAGPFGQIPMLYAARGGLRAFYAAVLVAAIITTAVGNFYAFVTWAAESVAAPKRRKKAAKIVIAAFFAVLGARLSSFGFSSFVTKVYPVFAVTGLAQFLCVCRYRWRLRG